MNTDDQNTPQRQEVVIVDFQMSFWSIVNLMIKVFFAAFIAAICIAFIVAALAGIGYVLTQIFAGTAGHPIHN